MNNKIIFVVLAIVVFAGGAYAISSPRDADSVMNKETTEKEQMTKDDLTVNQDDGITKEKVMDTDAVVEKEMEKELMSDKVMRDGSYEMYSPEKLAMAESGKVVLFFKASWCPTCRAVDIDIKESLVDIPEGVTILEVDYDKATELKKKYGVTSQHTFVQVDASGKQLNKWSGGLTLESILSNLK